jgi:DNA-directed RNA polymerase specialized sigma subunit
VTVSKTYSYREIAAELGVSWQMVQKIEQRALAKAWAILHSRGYTWEDFRNELAQEPDDPDLYE